MRLDITGEEDLIDNEGFLPMKNLPRRIVWTAPWHIRDET